MTKVKMDVMRPWIANRVTELIGFEDEVLINFIYGLLDGKVIESPFPVSFFIKDAIILFHSLISCAGNLNIFLHIHFTHALCS